jgi:glc operon protein GlcG
MNEALLMQKQILTLAAAKKAADAAVVAATGIGVDVVVAVVDDGGNVISLQRMDRAPVGCVEVAIGKAKASAIFKTETKNFEAGLQSGVTSLLTLGVVTFGGGVPVLVNGNVLGGIGVSGGSPEQDAEIAKAGVAAVIGEQSQES